MCLSRIKLTYFKVSKELNYNDVDIILRYWKVKRAAVL